MIKPTNIFKHLCAPTELPPSAHQENIGYILIIFVALWKVIIFKAKCFKDEMDSNKNSD